MAPRCPPVTTYVYDHLGRTISVTDPNNGVTQYSYDANGNLLSVKDPGGNTTSYVYDHLGRMTSQTDATSQTDSYTYDALGEMTSKTDKNGRVTDYTFDHDGQMTQEQWMSGGTAIYTATFAYNAGGLLTSAVDTNSDYAYTYNADNQVTSVDNAGTPNLPHVVLADGYDHLGRRTSLSATVNGTADFLNNYAYDSLDRITQVTQQQTGGNAVAAKRVDFTYNADGQYATINRYADLAGTLLVAGSAYGYDSRGAITSLAHTQGATTLASYTWTYDAMGRLTGATSNDGTDSYTYDAAGQETSATHSYQASESYS